VRVSNANAIANSPPVTIAASLGNRSGTLSIGVDNVRIGTLRMISGQIIGSIGQLQLNGDLIAEGLPGQETGNQITSRVVLGSSQRKINVIGTNTALRINGSIRDPGSVGGFVKLGTGDLELQPTTEANTYRGRTTVSEGILRLLPGSQALTQIPAELVINNVGKVENQTSNVIADAFIMRLAGQGVYHQQTGAETFTSIFGIENSQVLVSGGGVVNVLNGSTHSRLDLIDNARVTLSGDTRVLGGTVTTQETSQLTLAGNLILRGGRVDGQGSNPILFQRNITAEASPLPAVLAGKIAFAAAPLQLVSHRLDVFDGPNATDLLIEGTIEPGSSNLKLFKAATGTMVIQGNVNAANTIELAAGNMFVNSTLAQANVVVSQGVLGGIGQFRNVTLNGGTLAPGLSPGQMNAVNFIFGPAARYRVELNGVTPVPQHDQISAGGVILGDFINRFPTLEVLVNFNTSLGQEFEIANVNNDTGATGRFKDLNGVTLEEGSEFLAGGKNFRISYVGGDGNDVTIRRVSGSPAFENRALTPEVDEGGFVTLSGLITEPDEEDTFFLDVDWGDGTVETFTFLPGTPRQIAVAHQYLISQDAPIPVHVAWRDEHGGENSAVLSTQVRNVAPVIIGPEFDAPPAPGESSTLRFRIYDPSPFDAFRVEIRWGDGSPVEVVELPAGTTQVELAHQFRRRPSRVRTSVSEVSAPST
jgi:autotransporter-associated beta strand protein